MTALDAAEVQGLIAAISARVAAERQLLNRLDAALGDGDHGTSISTAFALAVADIAALEEPGLSAIWLTTAEALMNRMGGASGAIFGSFFLRGVALLRELQTVNKAAMDGLLQAGLDGVKARGRARMGDKTMVDALEPAVLAFAAAEGFGPAWSAAAAAARGGAEATRDLVARKGRAKYLGERAIGHIDSGAMTVALMFEALDGTWGASAE